MLFSCSTSYQSNFLIFYLNRTRKMCRLRVHLRAASKAARKPFKTFVIPGASCAMTRRH